MKIRNLTKIVFGLFIVTLLFTAIIWMPRLAENGVVKAAQTSEWVPIAGGKVDLLPEDNISDERHQQIIAETRKNLEKLEREGKIAPAVPQAVPLSPVLRAAPGVNDFGIDAISNYVDHNFGFPGQVRDYNCGIRTFDLADGFNHSGTDFFPFPFWWKKMDDNAVEVVAGASGVIAAKIDGNFDRTCGGFPGAGNWNIIVIRHADGSVAWYGHLKAGSLTTKSLGSTVAAGELLGTIGSSGPSTNPHLHLEIRINNSTTLQDPFQGPCNLMNASSWWSNQESYRVSRINKLMTHSAPPVFPTCPQPEITNEKNTFLPGETLTVGTYYRDELAGQSSQMSLIRPDGSIFHEWSHTASETASASYWIWEHVLPPNVQGGAWKFRVDYNSQIYEHTFNVVNTAQIIAPYDFDGDHKTDISVFRPSDGSWWYLPSVDSQFRAYTFGVGTDIITPGDYTGDGRADIAIWRPSDGFWYILRSEDSSFFSFPFGALGDIPAPTDYDGDGKTDTAVFRPSSGTWFILNSSGSGTSIVNFGTSEDKPVPTDFDGDGKADIAIFRPSDGSWWYVRSTDLQFRVFRFGVGTDKPAQGDYTGDGKADITVFRPSTGEWFVQRSEDNTYFSFPFGALGDIPVPGDYDGDGRFDAAVFRPSTNTWFMNQTSSGVGIVTFGSAGDRPVPNAYVR